MAKSRVELARGPPVCKLLYWDFVWHLNVDVVRVCKISHRFFVLAQREIVRGLSCVCVCVYVFICMCLRMYVCVCVHVCVRMCVFMCVCLRMYVCVCACVCVCMCVCMYVYVCMYAYTLYVYVCMYVCMYVCTYAHEQQGYVHACIHTYIHTYIHTFTHNLLCKHGLMCIHLRYICAIIYDLLACYSMYITCLFTLLVNLFTTCFAELFCLHDYIILFVHYGVVE
jgi:hypothetical protein